MIFFSFTDGRECFGLKCPFLGYGNKKITDGIGKPDMAEGLKIGTVGNN